MKRALAAGVVGGRAALQALSQGRRGALGPCGKGLQPSTRRTSAPRSGTLQYFNQ